jgi:hypothetical protein
VRSISKKKTKSSNTYKQKAYHTVGVNLAIKHPSSFLLGRFCSETPSIFSSFSPVLCHLSTLQMNTSSPQLSFHIHWLPRSSDSCGSQRSMFSVFSVSQPRKGGWASSIPNTRNLHENIHVWSFEDTVLTYLHCLGKWTGFPGPIPKGTAAWVPFALLHFFPPPLTSPCNFTLNPKAQG